MTQPLQREWYEIKAEGGAQGAARTAELYIYGNIGDRWDENSVTAANLVRDLQVIDADTITVRINSYGGSVPDALAIYNALKRHPADIDVQVDGIAVSSAGYIAMAGDKVTMADNAMLMIHAPWGVAMGNAKALREQAAMLDKYAAAMASSYASKSGKKHDDCMALLSDGADHWFTAAEAMAEGWCDAVGPAVAVSASFDLSRFSVPAAAAAFHLRKEPTMTAPQAATPTPATPATPAATAVPAPAFARTKEMNTEVLAMFQPFVTTHEGVQALQTEILADPGISLDQVRARLLAHLGKGATPANPKGSFPRIDTLADETDKFRAAASAAIVVRAGMDVPEKADIRGNPYRGYRLLDIARASLDRIGVDTRGMSQMDVVAAAFTQGTSDFPVLLENAMHKSLQAAYAKAALTWRRFCAVGSVSDFRAHNRYRVGSFGNLDSLSELGEFKNKSIPDGEKSSITASTKGNIINLSRQTVINDDLGAFVGLSASLAMAAARTVEASVYAMLAENSGLGPTMSDTKALFHADHSNIAATGAISVTVFDSIRQKLASQTDVSGNDYLDLRPSVIVTPMASGSLARSLNAQEYDDDSQKNQRRPNVVRGLFRDVVDSPRLTGTRVYAFADPGEAPVLEVAFLDGQQEPYLEAQDGFTVDGAQYKVRLDYGTAAIDYRGAATAAGA